MCEVEGLDNLLGGATNPKLDSLRLGSVAVAEGLESGGLSAGSDSDGLSAFLSRSPKALASTELRLSPSPSPIPLPDRFRAVFSGDRLRTLDSTSG